MLAGRSPSYAKRSGDIFFKPLLFVSFPTAYTKLESVFFLSCQIIQLFVENQHLKILDVFTALAMIPIFKQSLEASLLTAKLS